MDYKEQIKHPKWQKKRLEILERDQFQCKRCFDKEKTLVVHHKKYIKGNKIWEYKNDDLITFCIDCHDIFHVVFEHINYHDSIIDLLKLNKTDFYILLHRLVELKKQQKTWFKLLISTLTSYIIKKEDM